ncbi:hypothetical protein LCGC14_1689880 [marine sediment metagenome]|uniref:Uncharacterized protein n=1 Tax=marine sediment metagenome TaxID=412755 RepID=A0A0F9HLM5_9ZZZZ
MSKKRAAAKARARSQRNTGTIKTEKRAKRRPQKAKRVGR